jgi:phage-related holin
VANALKNKDVNFLKAYYRKPVKFKTGKSGVSLTILPIIIIAVAVVCVFILNEKVSTLKTEILWLENYIENDNNISDFSKSKQLSIEIAELQSYLDELNAAASRKTSGRTITLSDTARIYSCLNEGEAIIRLDFSKSLSLISLTALTKSELAVSGLAARLKSSGIFSGIDYSGYSYDTAFDGYSVVFNCVFK